MKCLICNDNKDFTNFPAHLRAKHQMTEDDYNTQYAVTEENDFSEVNEEEVAAEDTIKTNPNKIRENIFDGPKEWSLEMTMKEYLDKKNLTLSELNSLVDRYTKGNAIDVTFQMKKNVERGEKEAGSLKDKNYVETPELLVAETLVKNYGFEVKTVSGQKPNKKWVLVKK